MVGQGFLQTGSWNRAALIVFGLILVGLFGSAYWLRHDSDQIFLAEDNKTAEPATKVVSEANNKPPVTKQAPVVDQTVSDASVSQPTAADSNPNLPVTGISGQTWLPGVFALTYLLVFAIRRKHSAN